MLLNKSIEYQNSGKKKLKTMSLKLNEKIKL